MLDMVPADSGVIIGIDLERIASTRFGQTIRRQIEEESRSLIGDASNAQLEFIRGIRGILLAAPANNRGGRGLVLVRGSFPPAALQTFAAGAVESSFQGVRIFTKQQKQPVAVAFWEPSLLVGGDPETVRAFIARRGSSGAPDPVLMAQAREMNASYDAWLVARASLMDLARHAPRPEFNTLAGGMEKSIEQIGAGLAFGPMMRISVNLAMRTQKEAAAMGDALKMLIGLAVSGKNAQQIRPMLDGLELRVDANMVKLDLPIPEEHVITAIEQARKRERATAGSSGVVIQGAKPQDSGVTVHSSPDDMGVITLPAPKPQ
ncbi:MAG TPA: hypothetical protein PK157_13580 [Bryobacteraceae bacterium]|nr:hypothetical protein [Bryobacteraceae bacterium]